MSENLKEWIKDISVAVIIAIVILFFVMPTIVQQSSMEDTLNTGDYLFVSRQEYKLFHKDPAYGDIIVFQSELDYNGGKKLLVKRVIGVPGDTISISDGIVYRNGVALEEDYLKDGYTNGEVPVTIIPDGYLYCMGDNRLVSLDSRDPSVGLVAISSVKGKAVFRLFPLSKIGGLYK